MEMRPLGTSGLQVTPIGLGLAALGRPGYINLGHAADLEGNYAIGAMTARTYAMLDAAWAAGIRYFDTARSYGRGEAFLGAWLRDRAPAPGMVTIGSKWGYTYTAGWQVQADVHEVKEHSLSVFERQLSESRANLGEYLDLYQIHSATLESGVLANTDVLRALARLRADGVALGLSVSGPQQAEVIRRALALRIDGEALFTSVQATWNLLEPSAGTALAEAHAAGWAVVVKEAVANGRLAGRATLPPALAELCAGLNATPDAVALAAALAQPWADGVLSGATTVEQLESNLQALTLAGDFSGLAGLAESPASYWRTRAGLAWN